MTPHNILLIALTICIAILTGFMAWFLYYLIAIVRDLRQTSRILHEKVGQLGTILDAIRERIGDSVSTLSLLTQIVSKVADRWQQRRSKRSSKTSDEE